MHAYLEPAGFFRCLSIVKDKIRQRTIEAYKLETILMKKIIALAVAAVVAAPAMADLTIGASARYQIDNGTYTPASTGSAWTVGNVTPTAAQQAAAAAAGLTIPSNNYVAGTGAAASAASNSDAAASTNRVLVSVAGSTTAESGMFVSASATLQMTGDAGVSRDGDNAITVGNAAANVVLGAFEPAGAFNSGADQFQNGAAVDSTEGGLRARDMQNIGLNLTAVEGLTAQLSTDVDTTDDYRLVLGYDFGMVAATLGYEAVDAGDNLTSLTVGTTLGGVAVNASVSDQGDASSTNLNASYMGFGLAVQKDDDGANDEQEVYGSYALANAGGVEGFTVTVGFGDSDADGVDTRYGVRLDYAF